MTRAPPARALAYLQARRAANIEDLKRLVRFRTVSGDPRCASQLRDAASWLADRLRRAGLQRVGQLPGRRHPAVYAEWLGASGRPTVLVYGHYDVQPVDPESEWRSPPFVPTRRGSELYGRGSSDDKGQLLTHVHAIEALLAANGRLPVNVRCLFEGEEEIGSPTLMGLLAAGDQELASDVAVISDTRMLAPGRPALTYALRGSLSMELELRGPRADLHAGQFGGAVHNPLQALCEILAALHDPSRRIAIPHFYDRVRLLSARERARMRLDAPTDAEILGQAGAAGWGEVGFSAYERVTIRPALTINGLGGGYQGPGGKAVIPARANAKLGFRLVPDQDPREIAALVRRQLNRLAPRSVRIDVKGGCGTAPVVLDREHPAMRIASRAYRAGFGARPVFIRSGGTIPVVEAFQSRLGLPTVLMGFAHPGDRAHAPNEHFHLPNLERGAVTSIFFLTGLGELSPRPLRRATAAPSRGA